LTFPKTSAALARALAEREYEDATPVQIAVLAPDARGRDLLVSAQTGSGKTIAYGMAIAEELLDGAESMSLAGEPVALIIAPTRELAMQVQRELGWLYHHAGAKVVACVGGMDPQRERRELSGGVHIVVGTPGRLRDHLERKALRVTALRAVVLDEADEMLDMGFREDLEFILETTPAARRTLLFSATLPRAIVGLAKHYQKDALRIESASEARGHADIEYRAVLVAHHGVERAVVNLLRFIEPPGALVFCNTRNAVRHMEATLVERGFAAVALSGELSQSERNHALQALRDGRARVCVATDVAARGIDLPDLSLVIQAELPGDADLLQHRSGRTGRAGKKGVSVLLVAPSQRRRAEEILSRARVRASWGNAPSADDVRRLDQERLLQDPILLEPGSEEDLATADALLLERSPRALAAAFVKLYRARLPAPEDIEEVPASPEPARRERAHVPARGRRPAPGGAVHGVWFRLNVGRDRNADPKWILPEICRQGEVTKKDIGAIRIFAKETIFQIDPVVADAFTSRVAERSQGSLRIAPAPDQARDPFVKPPGQRAAPAPTASGRHEGKPATRPSGPSPPRLDAKKAHRDHKPRRP
jgi:ATP-dependent RNA helicase DeaD